MVCSKRRHHVSDMCGWVRPHLPGGELLELLEGIMFWRAGHLFGSAGPLLPPRMVEGGGKQVWEHVIFMFSVCSLMLWICKLS